MRALAQSFTEHLDKRALRKAVGLCALIGCAVLIGQAIAQSNWIYVLLVPAVVITLEWPIEVALGVYAALVPFEAVAAFGEKSSATTISFLVGAAAGMGMLAAGIARRRLEWPARPALWWLLFVLWSMLSVAWAQQSQVTIHMVPTVLSLLLLYLVAISWQITNKQFTILTWFVIVGGCIASCFVIYLFASGVSFKGEMGATGRATLVFDGREVNPNYLGIDLLLPFSLAMAWLLSARRWIASFVGICAVGLIAGAVFLTMSRGAVLSMLVVVAIFITRLRVKRRILLVAVALVLMTVLMPAAFFSRVQSMLSDAGSGRLDIWSIGIQLLKHYGIIGVGLANFQVAYDSYAGYGSHFHGYGKGAHNLYLETAVELGVVGVILMFCALVSHIRTLSRLRPKQGPIPMHVVALEGACWGTLVSGFFEGGEWGKAFWLTWTLCLMVVRVSHESKNAGAVPVLQNVRSPYDRTLNRFDSPYLSSADGEQEPRYSEPK